MEADAAHRFAACARSRQPTVGAAVPLKIVGFDDMSCRAWSASKADAEQRALYVSWVRGVLTGHNYANPEPTGICHLERDGRAVRQSLLHRKAAGQLQ
ncbi:MAG: hypothetical protein V9F01_15480 [Chitinophagaceae bacterium]